MVPKRVLLLQQLETATRLDAVDRVLGTLAQGIQAGSEGSATGAPQVQEGDAPTGADEELVSVEALLGSAFIVCQGFITRVVSTMLALDRACSALPMQGSWTRIRVMRLGSLLVAGTQYSEIECLDALAHYVRRGEDWRGDWTGPDVLGVPASRRAATIVSALGLQPFSTCNLRTASVRLGCESYGDLALLSRMLGRWCETVLIAGRSMPST